MRLLSWYTFIFTSENLIVEADIFLSITQKKAQVSST